MVFAKDPKQLYAAIIVMCLFGITTINTIVNYCKDQGMFPQAAETTENKPPITAIAEQDANNIYSQTLAMQKGGQKETPKEETGVKKDVEEGVEIISKQPTPSGEPKIKGKVVTIVVDNSSRSNPFLPMNENIVSMGSLGSSLPAPPTTLPIESDAGKVMTTTISGILYDKYSPSAIIKIEGADYLVKKGDIINNYKVLSIGKTQVIVQLGKNIYQAGAGELLSPTDLNYNTIANLNKKFGGNDVAINVRKKGY